ncbi:MAG: hypothetical protein AMJ64_02065 [Betaproteobacteria bacterium SG8_39]|nr:MAG: hypothetical protein AMJ64_02065 [Betaproteobacteria bacterium SG8_39]
MQQRGIARRATGHRRKLDVQPGQPQRRIAAVGQLRVQGKTQARRGGADLAWRSAARVTIAEADRFHPRLVDAELPWRGLDGCGRLRGVLTAVCGAAPDDLLPVEHALPIDVERNTTTTDGQHGNRQRARREIEARALELQAFELEQRLRGIRERKPQAAELRLERVDLQHRPVAPIAQLIAELGVERAPGFPEREPVAQQRPGRRERHCRCAQTPGRCDGLQGDFALPVQHTAAW